ncbi:helicase-related protein [Persephonella sp.]
MKIEKGCILVSQKWNEPVVVEFVENVGDFLRITGRKRISGEPINEILTKSDLEIIEIVNDDTLPFSGNSEKIFLILETKRYRYLSLYDPLLAINTSKVDPLPHQIEAVYDKVLKLPRIRFLIADDPGAGKTIMAGLIIKELKIRGLVDRILIVTPGHLKDQWKRELKDRFEEKFIIVDRYYMNSLYGENPWFREKQIIVSIDFAKQDEIIQYLSSSHFDLIIVDEAHKMSAYQYGEKTYKSKRYKLGEVLSQISEHLLFLTATPHKGDPENFRLFLDLLEPGFFATSDLLELSIENEDNPLFIRRLKEDLKDFEGKPLFLPRHVRTIPFSIKQNSPKEVLLYNQLSRYVESQYNKALSRKDGKRNVAFALVILQRRFASSIYALYRSLVRRKSKLEDLYKNIDDIKNKNKNVFDFEDVEDLSEEERWKEEEIWETLSVAENREELRKEINKLEELINLSKEIIENEEEIKIRELKDTLFKLNKDFPNEKVIIFTESKDTLEYLERKIKQWGYSVITIHGGMSLDERIKAESIFRNEKQILIATEAAGEGINLQFCHLMINYDIPWNPNRLEQRMGRIHRYGQTKEVYVFNLVNRDTREGQVLNRLFEKLEEIKNALGSDKVFDVISEVLEGKNLSQLLLEAAVHAKTQDEILREIDIKVDEEYIRKVKDNLGDTLATRFIDYTRIREMRDKALEHKLIPEYTENFFKKAFILAGGRITERKDGFLSIDSIPFEIRDIANDDNFKKKFGSLLKSYKKVTFDKDTAFKNPEAEFISFGHPLFEAILEWVEKSLIDELLKGGIFYDPDKKFDGEILYFEGSITDGRGKIAGKRLFAFYFDNKTQIIKEINPSLIWDLKPVFEKESERIDIEKIKMNVMNTVLTSLVNYQNELKQERERQAKIKEKYGIKSLEYLIHKLNDELLELEIRKERGENVDLPIRNKEERRRKYEHSLRKLKEDIKYETNLNISMPQFVGAIRVKPYPDPATDYMVSDEEIEKIGMRIAMEYEKKNGRIPEDVSSENLGFDIRSKVKTEDGEKIERYIEVKARAKEGSIALTQNEWFKAKRFKDKYYLYVVLNAATNPDLVIIQNPAENLQPEEKIEVVRYVIPLDEINKKGDKGI